MENQIIAGILLLERLIALYFILSVIGRQKRLMKFIDDVSSLRKVMFGLSLAMLGMQFVPIIIDVAALIEPVMKSTSVPRPLGVMYALSNATFSIIASVMLWLIYETIDRDNIKLLKENESLKDDNAHLKDDKAHLTDNNATLTDDNATLTTDLATEKRKQK